jgi:hypothetical protein
MYAPVWLFPDKLMSEPFTLVSADQGNIVRFYYFYP